jgi:hypothetical protein
VVPYWLSDVVIVGAFGEEVSGRSNDHIVLYFTNLLLTEIFGRKRPRRRSQAQSAGPFDLVIVRREATPE